MSIIFNLFSLRVLSDFMYIKTKQQNVIDFKQLEIILHGIMEKAVCFS